MVCFRLLFRHSSGETEKNNGKSIVLPCFDPGTPYPLNSSLERYRHTTLLESAMGTGKIGYGLILLGPNQPSITQLTLNLRDVCGSTCHDIKEYIQNMLQNRMEFLKQYKPNSRSRYWPLRRLCGML
jgi:hypothetical protein